MKSDISYDKNLFYKWFYKTLEKSRLYAVHKNQERLKVLSSIAALTKTSAPENERIAVQSKVVKKVFEGR